MKKRILTVLLAVCLVFALGTVTALADGENCPGGTTCKHEAAIGETHYDTLGEAISQAADNATIELLNDVKVNIESFADKTGAYNISKNLTINGNNHSVTATAQTGFSNPNDVHVFNITGNVKVKINSLLINAGGLSHHGIHVYNGANVELNNVEIQNYLAYGLVVNDGGSTVTANNLVIRKSDDSWGSVNIDAKNATARGTFTNCEFNGDFVLDSKTNGTNTVVLNAVKATLVKTNTNDGTTVQSAGTNIIKINGGTIDKVSLNGSGKDTVTISGKALVTTLENLNTNTTTNKPTVTVNSSTVSNVTGKENMDFTANESVIGGVAVNEAVAKVGDTYYDDLKSAINAAASGSVKTVTLLKDIEVDLANVTNALYSINGNVTIDGNGKKIAVKDGSEKEVKIFNVVNATVKFEDLTIDGNGVARHGIQAYGTSCVVTLDNVNSKNNTGYGILANGGAKVTATKLYTSGNGWGGVNVESKDGATEFTMTSGTLADTYSVVVENSGTTTTASKVNLTSGTYNNIQIKTAKTDVTISGGSYKDIVGSSNPKYTLNGTEVSVTGGTFKSRILSGYVDTNYIAYGTSGYTYTNDISTAMSAAGQDGWVDYVGSTSTTKVYTVTFTYDKNNKTTIKVPYGTKIQLPTGTFDGKTIEGWKDEDGETYKVPDSVTIKSNKDFTVVLRHGQYNIAIDSNIKHGTVTTDYTSANKDEVVYVYVKPDLGYVLDNLKVTYGSNNKYSVDVKYVRNGVYKFTMPNAAVLISATFRYESLPFTDVNKSQWFYDEVYYVYTNGMMEGDSATTFNPDGKMTRAMFWAVLGRIDGQTITGNNWIDQARSWAMRKGVSDGTNPNSYVTREQMVTMLWRYAGQKNGTAYLGGYTDSAKISSYAVEAMRWAIANKIIEGMTATTLEPQGTATRAQCAAIFMRFDTK